jgi:hypothetical protein
LILKVAEDEEDEEEFLSFRFWCNLLEAVNNFLKKTDVNDEEDQPRTKRLQSDQLKNDNEIT